MGKLTPPLAAETEALRKAYAALNRNDIPATVKAFDPQIEWTEPAEYPGAETLPSAQPQVPVIFKVRFYEGNVSCLLHLYYRS
jgi:ketosteroid isomerase-like protein